MSELRCHHRPSAAARLQEALTVLTHPKTGILSPSAATVAELCRLAGVSRNSLYRYHFKFSKRCDSFNVGAQCRKTPR